MQKIIKYSCYFMMLLTCLFLISNRNSTAATRVVSLDGTWKISIDAKNIGKEEEWWKNDYNFSDSRDISVPGIIQQNYPDYHGVVWYQRSFVTPENDDPNGRFLLRFWQSDYYTEVWVNEEFAGTHEGAEDSFIFDVTEHLRPQGKSNQIVVRVIHPSIEPIDGFSWNDVPRRNGTNTISPGSDYCSGGLVDSVELYVTPSVYMEDLHLIPDCKTGEITVLTNVHNSFAQSIDAHLELCAMLADSGTTVDSETKITLPAGISTIEHKVMIPNFQRWELNSPNLYHISAELKIFDQNIEDKTIVSKPILDRRTATCGFREFSFENGAFRLNGKRIYVKCSHSGSISPATYRIPLDPDLFRNDIIFCKSMGFNMIRYISGMPRRMQLELCDRIGFMVYDECYAGWCLAPSPHRSERFEHAICGMIRRDRNHPCVVIWGLLNETSDINLVQNAVDILPKVQELGPGRMVILNSGNFDTLNSSAMGPFACWRTPYSVMPGIQRMYGNDDIFFDGTRWISDSLFMHPGDINHEYTVLQWTAPKSGTYVLDATFLDVVEHGHATVSLQMFHGINNGLETSQHIIMNSFLNMNGKEKQEVFHKIIELQENETISLIIGIGDGQGTGDTVAVDLNLTASDGTKYDAKNDFSFEQNPNGVWKYGFIPAMDIPNLDQFSLYTMGQETLKMISVGHAANPDSLVWQEVMEDTHPYQSTPHDAAVIQTLRTHGSDKKLPVFLSEYGIGSGIDLARLARLYEQHDRTDAADAKYYRQQLDHFMTDWNRWHLEDTFASPEDYFRQSLTWMADQRRYGINAIRSNPYIIAHSVTGTHDQGISGEGLTTTFREFKPGTIEVMRDLFSPLRLCLFVEPSQIYCGKTAKMEAVLVNEDILAPGAYPIRFQIIGPNNEHLFDEVRDIVLPEPPMNGENPFTIPVFSENIPITGPEGTYQFLATFQQGGGASGGRETFYAMERTRMPDCTDFQVMVFGDEPELVEKLHTIGIDTISWNTIHQVSERDLLRTVVFVGAEINDTLSQEFSLLYHFADEGASVVILSPEVLQIDNDSTAKLPFTAKGKLVHPEAWLYHKDDWNKHHAIFDGLPSGCVLDHLFYREVIPSLIFVDIPTPDVAVAGAFNTARNYDAGLTMALYRMGRGILILNTFRIEEKLGVDPVAERLLRNLIRCRSEI